MRRSLIVALVIALAIPVSMSSPVEASNPTLNFYISPPSVQNTFVSGARVATFDNKPKGPCPTEWRTDPTTGEPTGTLIGTITTNGCNIAGFSKFGGAVAGATDAQYAATSPAADGTNFVGIPSGKSVTLTLAEPETYLGFWWSAGDQNNRITLYSGGTSGTRVGIFQTSSLTNLLSGDTVTAIDNTSYDTCKYFGNPRMVNRKDGCAGTDSSYNPGQPYAYIHLIGEGGLTFDTIVFAQVGGGGFELDNIAIERNVSAPNTIILFPPELNARTPDLTSTTCEQFPSSFGLIASNFAQTPTYSISPTTLPPGLTFNTATGGVSGTPTTTFSTTTYTVTATADNTGTPPVTQTASTTVSLTVTECPPPPPPPPPPPNPPTPVVWEPETTTFEVTEFPAIITPDPPPPPPGGGTYTFTGDPGSTSNCTVNTITSAMTIPQPGTCVVTATVGDTKKLSKASITVTFTITGPQLAATGAPAWPVWAGVALAVGLTLVAWARLTSRQPARARNV